MSASSKANDKAAATKNTLVDRLRADGVKNPAGLAMFGFTFLFLGAVPVTSWLASPNGLLERLVNGVIRGVAFVGSAGSTSTVPVTGKIAAISTLYVATTFALTGAGSASAVAAANDGGRDNGHPRAQEKDLSGLPLRLMSAHHQMVETFGGYALVAALAQAIAPGDARIVNLLGLHVLAKVFLYYPAYVFNAPSLRSLGHVLATGATIAVGLQLSKKPLI